MLRAMTLPPSSRRSRWPFWVFVVAMVLAVLGGGAIVLLVKRSPEGRNFAADPGSHGNAPSETRDR